MAATPPSQSEETSYTAMETLDVQAIGAHCQMPFCGQLDFLPFRCESCKSTFCLDHRSETAHKCPKAGEWARNRRLLLQQQNSTPTGPLSTKPSLLTAQQCSEPVCKTFINTTQSQGVHCTTCNRHYCLKHRFPEEHDCKNLTPLGARPITSQLNFQSNADKIRKGFSKFRTWGKEKQEALKPAPKPTSRAAQIAALNALKKTAKGDAKIPVDKRVYLHVEAASQPAPSTDTNTTTNTNTQPQSQSQHKSIKKPLFFNADWPVGRLLDEAARNLGVQNVNNSAQGEEQRLRIYHVESGRVLPFSEKVSQALQSGNTVVLLRGVGDPEAEVEAVRGAQA